MKRHPVQVEVSDHAVLRFLEREHGLDVSAVKALIATGVAEGAALSAIAVVIGRVRFVLRDHHQETGGENDRVVVATALDRGMYHHLDKRNWRGKGK